MSITNLPSAHGAHNSPPLESKEVPPSHNSLPSATRRTHYQMVGGIHIPNEEGVRWFEQTYGRELPKDHREDASVRVELERILTELERGIWEHGNPDGIDEVSLPRQQMKGDSAREEQMRGILRKLGLQPGEFKRFYL
ncbi:hypothetical protein DFH08DRAFT_1073593 [Mycena albidolilacea]|uniref:Uncharacterized protein n=1 Tax=Mycena albidolilacea TaxID=1033008 RepID=A0AAD7ALF6_9AGAR|nr:hypothetical protein DFH08DRAFT_1073593 [Mycena albidolilacea]